MIYSAVFWWLGKKIPQKCPANQKTRKLKYCNRQEKEVIDETAEELNSVPKASIEKPYGNFKTF